MSFVMHISWLTFNGKHKLQTYNAALNPEGVYFSYFGRINVNLQTYYTPSE